MKNNYNIKVNPPELSSDAINKHKDFDALFSKFQETAVAPIDQSSTTETPVVPIKKMSYWTLKYGIGALMTIAAAVLVVFMFQQVFVAAGNAVPTDQINEALALQSPLPDLQKPFSNLVVNSAEAGEVLNYHSGSKIIVPPSAFVDEKGNVVKGKVEIQYREFNDHVDMFLAGVPKELDKHQNLQSVGMMEIKGFQDGKPVYLSMDKTLDVELKGRIAANIPTTDLGVYVYSKQEDAWEYKMNDNVEVLAQNTNPTPNINEKELRQQAEQSLASSKPRQPIKPGVPSNMEPFDFDIDVSQFPELKKYHQDIIFMAKTNSIPSATFDTVWNSMKLTQSSDAKYLMELTFESSKGNVIRKFEVYPAVAITRASEKQYQQDLKEYDTQLKQWESDVVAAVEQLKSNNQADWVDIINRFKANRFGLWNCGKTVEMKQEMEIGATFQDVNGIALSVDKLFITNKNKQLYYFAPSADNNSKATLKYDAQAQNLIWALTKENELLVANTKQPITSGSDYTFQMTSAGKVKTEEDLRKLLLF